MSSASDLKRRFTAAGPNGDQSGSGYLLASTKSAEGDRTSGQDHTTSMNDITRPELDAKLELIEARMDGRVASIESKIDGFLAVQAEREKTLAERDKRFEDAITTIRSDISRLGNLKLNIWGAMATAVGIGIAIVALVLSSYQAGRSEPSVSAPAHAAPVAAPKTPPPPPSP